MTVSVLFKGEQHLKLEGCIRSLSLSASKFSSVSLASEGDPDFKGQWELNLVRTWEWKIYDLSGKGHSMPYRSSTCILIKFFSVQLTS